IAATYLPHLCCLIRRPSPISPLFPYTTLFRSIEKSQYIINSTRQNHTRSDPDKYQHPAIEIRHIVVGIVYCTGNTINYADDDVRSEEHTSELQSRRDLVCRLLLEKKKKTDYER